MRKTLIALLAPTMLLTACGPNNRGLESEHQAVVARTDYVFDVQSSGYGLAPGEAARLAGWMASMRVGYGDQISVDDPSGSPGIRQEVAAQAAGRGLLLADTPPVTAGPVAPGAARIILSRATARVPSCPNFLTDVSGYPNFDGHTSANFGCGVNSTMARMVANPVDLVRGQPGTAMLDTAVSAKAIEAFRKATPSGGGGQTLKTETTGGK